jgi:hypothetical protein
VKVDGPLLYVEPLDLIDGSPVVDIKPYSAGWDTIFWARDVHSGLITQYMAEEQVLAELFREAFNFHGEKCAAIAVSAKIAYDAAQALETSVRDIHLKLPRNVNPHLADGLVVYQGLQWAMPGSHFPKIRTFVFGPLDGQLAIVCSTCLAQMRNASFK